MRLLRFAFTVVGLLFAVVFQTTAFTQLSLPGPAPAVMLVLVASIGLCRGRETGMVVGFVGGMLIDLAPPADHPLGRVALVYCVVGYVMGALRVEGRRSPFLPMALVGLGTAIGSSLDLLAGTVLGYVHASLHDVATAVPLAVLYDVVLTPFVFPVVAALDRRLVAHRELTL